MRWNPVATLARYDSCQTWGTLTSAKHPSQLLTILWRTLMRTSRLIRTASLALGCLVSASPLLAQANTGAGIPPGASDPNWTVSWSGLSSGSGQAVEVVSPPGAWANTSPTSYWVSTNSSASLPGGSGDNVERYNYVWTGDFTSSSTSPLEMTVWTDNFFHSFTFNGVTTTVTPATSPGDFNQPTARVFTLDPTAGANTLSFNTTGDGQTDAINVSFTSTPEPSSMALLGTGLIGLVPMIRRKRKI